MNAKHLLGRAAIAAAPALAIFVGFVATRPARFHIERSVTIAAPAPLAFARVDDLHAWASWSPYEKLDPGMERTFTGPGRGHGASYGWKGNRSIGEGRMTIRASEAPSRIAITLDLVEPFRCTNDVTFTFEESGEGNGTKVTWAMDGENSFVGKAMSLVFDTDAMVGGDFERGLGALKVETEAAAQKTAATAPDRSRP